MIKRRELLIGTVLLASSAAWPAMAADSVDMAAAKKEGKVVWYTSTPIEVAQQIVNMFQEKTGISVELFRSGGSAIIRRFQQELDAGHAVADVLTTSDPATMTVIAEKGAFEVFRPKNVDKLPEGAVDPKGYFFAQRLNLMTIYYNADKVKEADIPKTMKELTESKFNGKLVMSDPAFASLQLSVVGMVAKKFGWDYFEKLRKLDTMVVPGGQQVNDMIKRGERLIAVGASDSYAADARADGFKIVTVYPPDGTYLIPSPTAVVAKTAHPQAARVFAEFQLSDEVQDLFPKTGSYAARVDMPAPEGNPPLKDITLSPVDYDYIESNGAKIKKQFAEIFQ